MTKYVVEFSYQVYAETPAKAIQLASKYADRVAAFGDTLATLVPNLGDDRMPTGAVTGGDDFMCVITVKEKD